ncbi:MAG: AAA family ATPase [Planctomycetota bacterium]
MTGLSQFNYLFGSNGTGKTTISRIIADQAAYPDCSVTWKDGRPLETVVLNRDFVDRNFNQLKGVFTLGEGQKETREKIAAAKEQLDKEQDSLAGLRRTLHGENDTGGKIAELAQIETEFQEKCWAQKQKHDDKLQGPFTGYRNNAAKFKEKVLAELQANRAPLKPLGDLERRAQTVFGETPSRESPVPTLDTAALLAHESNPILKKRVIGKDDVDIAAMIKKLGNSDWVRQGRTFYEANDRVCPFCQQATTDAFAASLAQYFDETFETDSKAIDTLVSEYATESSDIQMRIATIIASPGKFLDVEKLKSQKAVLDQAIGANQLLLDNKKKEPSRAVELISLITVSEAIKGLIDSANVQVAEHNRTVDNLAAEKRDLVAEVWRFVLDELELDLRQYRERKEGLHKAIENLNKKIAETEGRIRAKQNEIRSLEMQITSVQPTIDGINAILSRFGFDSFKLAMSMDKKFYRLVRDSGEDARETLSEGEKAFVVFLYFYHLLGGSMSETGITTDRIVVFDDPVSSLDSDFLFIVSSLIREVCEGVRQGQGHIKQVFVFTHNIYFHREVTFNDRRKSGRLKEESFWIVRKFGRLSAVERHEDNPIKTSYELLWMDVRKPDPANTRIENTLRRILEHYFTILGSVTPDDICAKFDGQEKLICRSLFSWVNAGSHSADDDIYVTPSGTIVQNYLKVFRAIFEKTGHFGHYRMMMADDFVDEPAGIVRA